jgi:hypothetical protein
MDRIAAVGEDGEQRLRALVPTGVYGGLHRFSEGLVRAHSRTVANRSGAGHRFASFHRVSRRFARFRRVFKFLCAHKFAVFLGSVRVLGPN